MLTHCGKVEQREVAICGAKPAYRWRRQLGYRIATWNAFWWVPKEGLVDACGAGHKTMDREAGHVGFWKCRTLGAWLGVRKPNVCGGVLL